jgi:hypothetical protein
VYIFGLLKCVFSAAGLLCAYSRKWGNPGNGEIPVLEKLP